MRSPPEEISPFAQIPGWRKDIVYRDILHLDNLGYARDTAAGLLKSMHKKDELGPGTLDFQLRELTGFLRAWRKREGRSPNDIPFLNTSNCGMDNLYVYPEMASTVKAIRLEILLKYLCRYGIFLAELPHATEIAKVRGTCAWGYLQMHKVLDESLANGRFFLSDPEIERFEIAVRLFLLSLQNLGEIDNRGKIWRTRPKHHGPYTLLNKWLIGALTELVDKGVFEIIKLPVSMICRHVQS